MPEQGVVTRLERLEIFEHLLKVSSIMLGESEFMKERLMLALENDAGEVHLWGPYDPVELTFSIQDNTIAVHVNDLSKEGYSGSTFVGAGLFAGFFVLSSRSELWG